MRKLPSSDSRARLRARTGLQRDGHAAVAPRAGAGQYPIGDTENWQRIVANIAAIVDELERTFVAEIEAVVDPAPEWFEPGR